MTKGRPLGGPNLTIEAFSKQSFLQLVAEGEVRQI